MRFLKFLALVIVLAVVAAGALLYFTSEEVNEPEVGASATPASSAPSIYYVEGNSLTEVAPGDSEGQSLADNISPGAEISPDGAHLTWVAYAGPKQPVVHIYTFGTEGIETVPGDDPTWTPDGSGLAVVRPFGNTKCSSGECEGPVRVVEVDPETGEATPLINRVGEWSIVGWSGDDLLVGDVAADDALFLVNGPSDLTPLEDLAADDVRSVSPDGQWIVVVAESGPELWSLEDDSVAFEERFGGPEDTFTSIDWTEDSSRFAAILTTLEDTTIVSVGVDSSTPDVVVDDLEPSGDLFWAPDEQGVIFTAVNREEAQLEATYCPLDDGECSTYITWQTGTSVIAPVP